jgi:hypothetical protein
LLLDPAGGRDALVNAADDLHDVTICDLVIEGAPDPDPGSDPNSKRSYRGNYNRGGILFLGKEEGSLKNITFRNLTVRNCTYDGIFVTGAQDLTVAGCDLTENGVSVPPGARQLHNLHLLHCSNVNISDSRMDTSPLGCGIALTNCADVAVDHCETARNGWYGILISESKNIKITGSLVEANDSEGIMIQYLFAGSKNVSIENTLMQYNAGFGICSYGGENIKTVQNIYAGNGSDLKSNEKISKEKYINMK